MPPSVTRWVFYDPALNETWQVPRNPDAMTSPYPERKFVYNSTTAGANGGVSVVYEAHADPAQWQFSGKLKTQDHFNQLMKWRRKNNRVQVTDHLGRTFFITINKMDMVPVRVNPYAGEFWTHAYTATCSVYSTIDADTPAPHINSVTPHGTGGGVSVVIAGTNFMGCTAVTFGTTPATSFSVVDDNTINAVAPGGPTDDVALTVTTPKGTSNNIAYFYTFHI